MLPVAILAGGLATRLRPVTETRPKCLIEINGEPFLAHQLRLLRAAGVERVVMCVGFLGEQVRLFAENGERFALRVEYSFDGETLLGTAGALRRALPLLGESFLVLYGDSYLPCDYGAVADVFSQSGKPGLMTVFRNQGRWDTSNVEFTGGRILAYDKVNRTARMQHIDYGLGALRAAALERIPPDRPADLAALYRSLVQQGEMAACEVVQRFYEIGSFEGIRALEAHLSARRAVFLDRDGVLNEAVMRHGKPHPPASAADLRIVPGTGTALARLKNAGFRLIVVTNQPDVARGVTDRATVEEINRALLDALPLDDCFTCFHDDADGCECRKPLPGLLTAAAARYGIVLPESFMVGDRWRDVDAGAAAGCRTVWIDRGYGERGPEHPPDVVARDLSDAVERILHGG